MTGFLQRLAERVTGAAHPLRRASPILLGPPLVGEVRPVDVMIAAGVEAASSLRVPDRTHQRQQGQNHAPGVSAIPARRSEATSNEAEKAEGRDITAHRPVDIETSINSPADNWPPILVPNGPYAGKSDATRKNAEAWQSDPGVAASRSDSPFNSPPEMSAGQPESLLPARFPPTRIEPLLPLAKPERSFSIPSASTSLANQTRHADGMIEEATEVHVSIGRIEVTAVHEPAPAKPAAPRRNAPMSLDDYLAKRHGGRP
jgi:hypothetical protein